MHDLRSDSGFRAALFDLADVGGWDGPTGRRLLRQFRVVAAAVAGRALRAGDVRDPHLVDHLVGVAWEVSDRQRDELVAADRPWAYLLSALARAASSETRAAELLTTPRRARDLANDTHRTARRVGSAAAAIESVIQESRRGSPRRWDAALVALHRELVDAGAPTESAAEAIELALDLLERTVRRSWLHHVAYRDAGLASSLSRHQVRALMDLLIGSRRDGPQGSAWLALRQAARSGRPAQLAEVHPQSVRKVTTLASAWPNDT